MPAYLASRCDLKTCTRFRAMIARRTRRISSSLLPLNITPAMTSTQPPAWWKGPLGPLTTGRDLYEEGLRVPICRLIRVHPIRLVRPDRGYQRGVLSELSCVGDRADRRDRVPGARHG